ncbi:ChbG/HpnK family deacetylase [Granulicella tundricola]|uniref:YdjC family protein n=1 Tax=Granulicella tundricola (strain ATCC BAA-1859 / DSM 23138 / MP5ACTX9) TaxID=1198114 RepID=E8WWD7_GRATM|nr:ChbG/HpnK family deacetylase [Granulicella tundricola]ADW68520.1 YdjC family protein [Granulicella tundricola MP5ACTX9]
MPARLILNADDFGLTPGINRGIVELHHAGALTSTTLMATAPAFEDAAALARTNPTLGIGCHLTFVDGFPAAHPQSIPTLLGADGKTFRPSLADFAQAALRGTIEPDDIARETQAQIQRLQRAGIDVTHIDTHKHTHIFPAISAPVLHIAQRCGIPAIRYPFEPSWSAKLAQAPFARRVQLRILNLFAPSFRRIAREPALHGFLPTGTLGIAATGTLDAPTLRAILSALPPVGTFELCCHPGHIDSALTSINTRLRASRQQELQALLEVIPELSRTPDAPQLIHYGNLGIPGLQRASGHFEPFTGYEKVL